MKKIQPGHIIHYYFTKLGRRIGKMKQHFSEDSIHLFRTEVKRLRAFLRMMRIGMEDPDLLNFPRPFKKMYSIAGEIRDRQLCIKRLVEDGPVKIKISLGRVRDWKKEIREQARKKDGFPSKKELVELEGKMRKRMPGMLGDALVKNFFLQKLETIRSIVLTGDLTDTRLHSIRKCIKDIAYVHSIVNEDFKAPLPFSLWTNKEMKQATGLAHTLGLFNDTNNALSLLTSSAIQKSPAREKKYLLVVRRKWLAQRRKLRKELLSNIHQLRPDLF